MRQTVGLCPLVWGNFRKKVILSIAGLFNFYTDLRNK
jgi:hypothetical protein